MQNQEEPSVVLIEVTAERDHSEPLKYQGAPLTDVAYQKCNEGDCIHVNIVF